VSLRAEADGLTFWINFLRFFTPVGEASGELGVELLGEGQEERVWGSWRLLND